MTKISEPIVFFGSGPVAAKSLELLNGKFKVEAVVTKPRPAHHKGSFPVIDYAKEHDLPVYTVTNRASLDELMTTKPFKSRLAILIDFGIIVSQYAIDYFPLGIINSHFSLLPEWRGADPITFSILSGQQKTGISLMLLTAGMDEGPLLAQSVYELPDSITTPELTDRLIQLSYESLVQVVPRYITGQASAAAQEDVTLADSKIPSYSRKLTKEDSIINWTKPAVQIEREVRAFIEWPRSRADFKGLELVVVAAHILDETGAPGATAVHDKKPLVYCGEGALVIDMLKPAGKQEMTGEAFLAGYKSKFLN